MFATDKCLYLEEDIPYIKLLFVAIVAMAAGSSQVAGHQLENDFTHTY